MFLRDEPGLLAFHLGGRHTRGRHYLDAIAGSGGHGAWRIALDQAGIEIPYHHLQLFLEKVDERVWHQAAKCASLSKSSEVSGTADLS